jgi:hypothetical protein
MRLGSPQLGLLGRGSLKGRLPDLRLALEPLLLPAGGEALPMSDLTDEQRRALRMLAGHPAGCAEAVLLAHGFPIDLLGTLVFDKLATMEPSVAEVGGRKRILVWVQITATGRKAIAE